MKMVELPAAPAADTAIRVIERIIRPFEFKEIYLFYYFIDAGELCYSNVMH